MKVLAIVLLAVVAAQGMNLPHLEDPVVHLPIWKQFFEGKLNYDEKIVGGAPVNPPHSVPWQVGLLIDAGGFCGGTIINVNTILTAAHCLDGARTIQVTAGDFDRNVDENEQIIRSTNFTIHPAWNPRNLDGDLGVIHLPTSLTINANVSAIKSLAAADDKPDPYVGQPLTVTGWGLTSDRPGSTISDLLNTVTVPGMSTADCAKVYNTGLQTIITNEIVCIDTTGGKGSCNGDSGGPLTDENGVLVGIVSFGSSAGCAKDYPAGFTRVSSYRQWIDQNSA
jgi:secreted trypsin-like serine protease